jgi:hypothetical protein
MPGGICLSEQSCWQVKQRLDLKVSDLGAMQLKKIAEPVHVYSLEASQPAEAKPLPPATPIDQAKALASKRPLVRARSPQLLPPLSFSRPPAAGMCSTDA